MLNALNAQETSSDNRVKAESDAVDMFGATSFSSKFDTSTMSSASMALAKAWVGMCLDEHPRCASFGHQERGPARLVNITRPESPFLENAGRTTGEYVALSYKWGQSRRLLTCLHNLEAHYQALPLHSLPRTFKDAIRVARVLGCSFLWIDALCIIQDSPEDQAREISRMGTIFRGAMCTIFAKAADNADTGLGVLRDPRHVKPCKLTVEILRNAHTVVTSFYVIEHSQAARHFFNDGSKPKADPLEHRGWVRMFS